MMSIIDKIMGGIIAALLIALAGLWLVNAHVRTNLAEAQAQNAAYMAANDEFKAHVENQNRAIKQMQAESEARTQAAIAAAKEAQKTAKLYADKADDLRRRLPTGDDCAATKNLFDNYMRGM